MLQSQEPQMPAGKPSGGYFDRYLKILAPGLDVMNDSRVSGLGNGQNEELPAMNGLAVVGKNMGWWAT